MQDEVHNDGKSGIYKGRETFPLLFLLLHLLENGLQLVGIGIVARVHLQRNVLVPVQFTAQLHDGLLTVHY